MNILVKWSDRCFMKLKIQCSIKKIGPWLYSVKWGFRYKRFLRILNLSRYTHDYVGVVKTHGLGFFLLAWISAVFKKNTVQYEMDWTVVRSVLGVSETRAIPRSTGMVTLVQSASSGGCCLVQDKFFREIVYIRILISHCTKWTVPNEMV